MDTEKMKMILLSAIRKLVDNDKNLVILDEESEVIESIDGKRELERKLHEVCINHKLAIYLEEELRHQEVEGFYVDIEYNRYYRNEKWVIVNGEEKICRPDIIIHKRTEKAKDQHLLVIEAKKNENSNDDRMKIRGFMLDERYQYKYGARINYRKLNNREVEFFVHKSGEVISEILPN